MTGRIPTMLKGAADTEQRTDGILMQRFFLKDPEKIRMRKGRKNGTVSRRQESAFEKALPIRLYRMFS